MSRPSWADERLAMLRKLHALNRPYSEIAETMGTTRGAVAGQVHRSGMKAEPPPRKPPKKRVKVRPQNNQGRGVEVVVVPPEILDIPPDTSPFACTIGELESHSCRWPLDMQASADMRYCGDVKFNGASYCKRHARIAWKQPGARM